MPLPSAFTFHHEGGGNFDKVSESDKDQDDDVGDILALLRNNKTSSNVQGSRGKSPSKVEIHQSHSNSNHKSSFGNEAPPRSVENRPLKLKRNSAHLEENIYYAPMIDENDGERAPLSSHKAISESR